MIRIGDIIKVEKDDAPQFIEHINKIMRRLIFQYAIKEVSFIKIRNWFDYKWLNYSGKSIIHFEQTLHPDNVALKEWWADKITVPPFHPKRVLYNRYFKNEPISNSLMYRSLHRYKTTNENIHNRIENYTNDGLLVWFSSNTKVSQRGSLMMYRVQEEQVHSWYATFENKNDWEIIKSKGIELNELKGYLK